MATLNELAYNIKNIAYGGNTNSEQNVSTQQIKFWIHYYRAQILGEMIADGRGVPIDCYQRLSITQDDDVETRTAWKDYHDTHTVSQSYIIPFSGRTANAAGISKFDSSVAETQDTDALELTHSYFFEEPLDYGIIRLRIPQLVTNNSKHGLGTVRAVAINDDDYAGRRGGIDISVVTRDEYYHKKHNRFTNNTPTAHVLNNEANKITLTVDNLKSVDRATVGGYNADPKSYAFIVFALLKNPTENNSWTSDDLEYPLPQEMISELNRRILSAEMQASLTSLNDSITDNADTTKIIQPQTQG
tara:strand:- start:75 stop:980 length:906 start_codon:yes stop_codon:yes gene_type:complete